MLWRNYKFRHNTGNRYIQAITQAVTMADSISLVLVHVIFRHGDRTPDKPAIYPKDPHKGYDYSPYGYGHLTNDGKRRAYRLGQSLRKRYCHFLQDTYKPEILDAWTSDFDRTKMTLQLVMSSLFPPRDGQVWQDGIQWQPIPYNYIPRMDDKMFLSFVFDKWAVEEYNNYVNGPGQKVMDSYADIITYVEKHSGTRINNPRAMFSLACTLATQECLGLKLPEWTNKVWPAKIEEIAMKEFEFTSATTRLKSLIIGKLLKKVTEDSLLKIKGLSEFQLHLYSCHDFTIGMLLKTLGIFDNRHPDFCSNIIVELHKIDGVYGFKFRYQCSESDEVKLMDVPNVGSFWPIEDFIEHHDEILKDNPFDLKE